MTRGYDALRRCVEVRHQGLAANTGWFRYAFDKVGNRLAEEFLHESTPNQDVYRYDSLGRLVFEGRGAALGGLANNQPGNPTSAGVDQRTWQLDGVNNWFSVTGTGAFPTTLTPVANEMNEYTSVDGAGGARRRSPRASRQKSPRRASTRASRQGRRRRPT